MSHGTSILLCFLAAHTLTGARADDWPQWMGPQRDGVWRESGIVERFPADGPGILWRTPVGGGYAGPAVADGRVVVTDRHLAPAARNPDDPFDRGAIPGTERVLCLSADDGTIVWEHTYDSEYTVSYPAGPRATPLVREGRVFTLGAEGTLLCLKIENGDRVWRRDFTTEFGVKTPMWGFAAHPLMDGDRLICLVGASNGVAMAFHKDTGEVLWRALDAREPGYCPPTMIEVAGRRQLIVWHPESVNALDPETGRVLWSLPWEIRAGLSIPQPRQFGDRLFLTAFYNGPLMLKLNGRETPEVLWRAPKVSEKDTWGLHSIMPTPLIEDGHIYGVCSYGQLRCLKVGTGERVWETFKATTDGEPVRWANAFLIKHENRFFLFNEQGDLIIARLTPDGYEEIDRAHLLEPTSDARGRTVVWSHPAFAQRRVFARNDKELICVSLATEP